ncbi:hypothetical protein CDL15_Pgr008032 [Punica granatum]|uniref:Uncharacterized protein n=1 Tax=Punica granatum TaxID=22663 RepID=A0A218VRY4_PUNGR|nr:hypothetical protein CDL15_Pgr008032 [Punica granatum]
MGHLKILNLNHSQFLTKTPEFIKFPNLKELILEDGTELKELHFHRDCKN